MAHLRDSSFVAQEADTVLIVFRRFDKDFMGAKLDTMLQGLSTIKIDKARRSGTMGLKIKVKKGGNELTESLDEPEESNESKPVEKRTTSTSQRWSGY